MANALNGIAKAVPPLPRRNHATPVATCAALAPAHQGQLLDSPPPGPSSPISAAAAITRVLDNCVLVGNGMLYERGKSPTRGSSMCFSPCRLNDMWARLPVCADGCELCAHITETSHPQTIHGFQGVELPSHRDPSSTVQLVLGKRRFHRLGWICLWNLDWSMAYFDDGLLGPVWGVN